MDSRCGWEVQAGPTSRCVSLGLSARSPTAPRTEVDGARPWGHLASANNAVGCHYLTSLSGSDCWVFEILESDMNFTTPPCPGDAPNLPDLCAMGQVHGTFQPKYVPWDNPQVAPGCLRTAKESPQGTSLSAAGPRLLQQGHQVFS